LIGLEDSQLPTHKTQAALPVAELEKQVKGLMSDDYFEQLKSTFVIERYGKEAAVLIIEMMLKSTSSLDKINDGTYMLQVIGKNAVEPILKALGTLKIEKNHDVYLLNGLVETLGDIGDKSAAPAVAQLVDKLNNVITESKSEFMLALCQDSKVRTHAVLAELQDKSRYDDLLNLLGDGTKRVPLEVVNTLAKIGDKRALVPLLKLFNNSDGASYFVAQSIKETFREIARREKVEMNNPLFSALADHEIDTLSQLYPKQRPQNGNHTNGTNGKHNNGKSK
jgi:HEAT repeat protein